MSSQQLVQAYKHSPGDIVLEAVGHTTRKLAWELELEVEGDMV